MNQVLFGAGRIGRLEYFMWQAGIFAAYIVVNVVFAGSDGVVTDVNEAGNIFLFSVPLIWILYAQSVRRAHDRNHTGWLVCLFFFPILNIAVWVYLQFFGSYDVVNRWGAPAERRALSADELAAAKAILAENEAAKRAYVENDLLTEDGSFDMDGLFTSNPGLRGDGGPTTASLPPPPPPPPPPSAG